MAWSKTCKIATFIALSATAVLVLIILINASTKLCENKDELFHRPTSKCYKKSNRILCNNTSNLVFLEESPRSQYGECSCPHLENNERSMLYDKATDHCYFIFSKGFCEEGSWINVFRNGTPYCEPNTCLHLFSETDVTDDVVPLKGGKCGILNTKGEGCQENETIRFFSNHILPRCDRPKRWKSGSVGVPASSCPLGSYPSIMGKCQPDFDFDK